MKLLHKQTWTPVGLVAVCGSDLSGSAVRWHESRPLSSAAFLLHTEALLITVGWDSHFTTSALRASVSCYLPSHGCGADYRSGTGYLLLWESESWSQRRREGHLSHRCKNRKWRRLSALTLLPAVVQWVFTGIVCPSCHGNSSGRGYLLRLSEDLLKRSQKVTKLDSVKEKETREAAVKWTSHSFLFLVLY